MKLRRWISMGLVAVLLAGCGNGAGTVTSSPGAGTTGTPTETPAAAGETLELTYQYWDLIPDQETVFKNFTDSYKEETGNTVTIKGQFVSDAGWEDILKTQIASGSGPEVFHMDLNNASAWKDNVIQPLSPYFEDSFWEQFVPTAIDVWKLDGAYYAVPNSFSVCGILYNKEMFAEAGIQVDSTTRWTLDDFDGALEKLYSTFGNKTITHTDGKQYPYYYLGTTATMYWWWLLWGQGGVSPVETNNIAQAAYVDGIMKIAEYANKGYLTTNGDVLPAKTSNSFSTAGNVAMLLTGDWTPTAFYRTENGIGEEAVPMASTYGSLPYPVGKDGKVHTEIYNQGVVLNKNLTGTRAQIGADFIEYMTTGDAWLAARGPEVGGLGIPARQEWATAYAKDWFPQADQRDAFVWTAENGLITSPDYHLEGIDVTTPITEVINFAYGEALKPDYNAEATRQKVVEKLEAAQKSLNTQYKESGITPDNPDATVK